MGPTASSVKQKMMMHVISLVMTCFEAANEPLNAAGWVDLPSGYTNTISGKKV
jgi:hypothetical protein